MISTLQEGSEIGGHVWFYAPGGIVVGSTAVFNVGSLLLTTNNVTNFSTSANGFNASFSGPSGSNSSISIQNGAQINALKQGSYVALIAPRIEQGGKIRVNGSAAYAAGEQLTMTMNQGLFDIQVNVGTTDGNGIVHTGETSGPANATAADNHKIYMVAVPKNQALTMLLGGTVGFDDATSASVKNGQIWLSAGNGVQKSNAGTPAHRPERFEREHGDRPVSTCPTSSLCLKATLTCSPIPETSRSLVISLWTASWASATSTLW